MKSRVLIIIAFVISIGFTGTAFASEYTGETPLYLFDYLKDKPIAYIIDYKIDGYLRNAVVNFGSNTIIFEIKDDGILTVEIPKTHFLPNDYFPILLIDKVNEDPREFLVKDEECFKEYEFSVNQNTMIELIMEKSSNVSSVMNKNILVNCQSKIDNKVTDTFDFNTIFEDNLEYTIIDGKQYLSKTIKLSLAHLTHNETIFELSEIKFYFYDEREDKLVYPGMGLMGMRTPILFEFPDGRITEIHIKTIPTPHNIGNEQYTTIEIYARPNWPEVGVLAGLIPSNQITKLLVFEKNISPYTQLQFGIDSKDISCKVGLELIQKHDGAPACIKSESHKKLFERGWTKLISIQPEIEKTGKYSLEIDDDIVFEIQYSIEGADVLSMNAIETESITVNLDGQYDGSLTIFIPRQLIDAKISEEIDDAFFVFVDGNEVPYTEIAGNDTRTLTISFKTGSKIIEIFGVTPL